LLCFGVGNLAAIVAVYLADHGDVTVPLQPATPNPKVWVRCVDHSVLLLTHYHRAVLETMMDLPLWAIRSVADFDTIHCILWIVTLMAD